MVLGGGSSEITEEFRQNGGGEGARGDGGDGEIGLLQQLPLRKGAQLVQW
jgi:hypothetical protein